MLSLPENRSPFKKRSQFLLLISSEDRVSGNKTSDYVTKKKEKKKTLGTVYYYSTRFQATMVGGLHSNSLHSRNCTLRIRSK